MYCSKEIFGSREFQALNLTVGKVWKHYPAVPADLASNVDFRRKLGGRKCCITEQLIDLGQDVVSNWLCDTKQSAKDPSLSMQVVSRDPEYLPFANHLRRFNTPNHCPCGHPRPGTLHRSQSAFHMPMVRLDPVIDETMRSLTAAPLTFPSALSSRRAAG